MLGRLVKRVWTARSRTVLLWVGKGGEWLGCGFEQPTETPTAKMHTWEETVMDVLSGKKLHSGGDLYTGLTLTEKTGFDIIRGWSKWVLESEYHKSVGRKRRRMFGLSTLNNGLKFDA